MASLALGAATVSPPAYAMGDPAVAALQVALIRHGLYQGPVDGLSGQATKSAVLAFQRRRALVADGVAGAQTRAALGPGSGMSSVSARLHRA